jgi:Flp pilus assembly protein TadD
LLKATKDHPQSNQAAIALAEFYVSGKQFDKARAALAAAQQKSSDRAPLANMAGLVQAAAGDPVGAVAQFREAVSLAPQSDAYALNLARAQALAGDPDAAFATIDNLLKRSPNDVTALALGAANGLQSGRVEKAAGYVERLRQAAPNAPGLASFEGDLAMAQRRYKDAAQAYAKASLQGGSTALTIAHARANRLAGEPDPQKPLRDWLVVHPDDAIVRSELAESLAQGGDLQAAARIYEEGLARKPKDPTLLNNLAVVYDRMGDPRALSLAEQAYNAASQSPAVADTYGWLLVRKGDTGKGLDLLKQAAAGLPREAEVLYHHAYALAKAGRKADALNAARAAASLPASAAVKADLRRLIAELE